MHNDLSQLFTQPLNPGLVLALSLVAPGAITFGLIFIGRKLTQACWRGYWDAV